MAFAPAKTFAQSLSKASECGALQTLREFRCGSAARAFVLRSVLSKRVHAFKKLLTKE
jgi:hypothetical protein